MLVSLIERANRIEQYTRERHDNRDLIRITAVEMAYDLHAILRAKGAMQAPTSKVSSAMPEPDWWGGCDRCRRPYSDPGFHDLILPNEAWAQISPTGDEGGLLCPGCIIGALTDAGISTEATFRSGPLCGQTLYFGGRAPTQRAVEKDDEGRPYQCGAFVAGDPRWECIRESDHKGDHDWRIQTGGT